MSKDSETPSRFERLLLPGFAFKAVIIGGGYATGREITTFFLPSGPWYGLAAMTVATIAWSATCALTFVFARRTASQDYRTFFRHLLGPGWVLFEIAYLLALMVIMAVYAAAAGSIVHALTGLPDLAGALLLMAAIVAVAAFGNESVERLFKYVTVFLYGVFAALFILTIFKGGNSIAASFALPSEGGAWFTNGVAYASYSAIGAIVILPVTRHFRSDRDAAVAGLLSGPLAMAPAYLFLICMLAYYPMILGEVLPSDFMLQQLHLPVFRVVFQVMIFAAVLESATGGIHAINERVAGVIKARSNRELGVGARTIISIGALTIAIFIAASFGLVDLIARGYRWLSYLFLVIYLLPLFTVGTYWIVRSRQREGETADVAAIDQAA